MGKGVTKGKDGSYHIAAESNTGWTGECHGGPDVADGTSREREEQTGCSPHLDEAPSETWEKLEEGDGHEGLQVDTAYHNHSHSAGQSGPWQGDREDQCFCSEEPEQARNQKHSEIAPTLYCVIWKLYRR